MDILLITLKSIYGAFFVFAGVWHFYKPKFFYPFIPNFLPKKAVNLLAGASEIMVGIGIFIPFLAQEAALGIMALLILFLPIHIWDVFRKNPAIGNKQRAILRVPMQFLLLWGAYFLYTNT